MKLTSTGSSASAGAGEGQPFRDALETEEEKALYDEAFAGCDPTSSGKSPAEYVHEVGPLLNIYASDVEDYANQLAAAYVAQAETEFERSTRARAILSQGCEDALSQ
ncbi:MAG: hypothetical protein KatS3mg012_1814 [Gaiellaceae bacterium]|jgi:hypothetical protein|nr:MAG: hypothetical protein KatS3mg012_1814 [Gaiellaceae bacterium]